MAVARLSIVAAAILLASLGEPAAAEEHVVEASNFAIDLPAGEDWEPLAPGKEHRLGVAGANGKALIVQTSKLSPAVSAAQFQADFRKGFLESIPGARVLSESQRELAGATAHLIRIVREDADPAHLALASIVADGRHYSLLGVAQGADNDPDPEFTRALESFRFLRPPAPPEDDSTAYRVGYQIGYWIVPVLGIAGIAWVLLRRR